MPKVLIDGQYVDVSTDALFADDGQTPFAQSLSSQAVQGGRTFSEDDVARIRQEEKDKLYGQISRNNDELAALRDQVGSLTAAEQRREAQLEEEQQRLAAEAKRKEEEELDAKTLIQRKDQEWDERLRSVESDWSKRLQEQEEARLRAEALAQREREFSDLKDYIQGQVAANEQKIAPQLRSIVGGNTREEVDASVARAIEITDSIAAEMQQMVGTPGQQQTFEQQPQYGTPQPPPVPGTRVTGPVGEDPGVAFQQITPDQISSMPMDQYAKWRQQQGIGGQSNNRGLFG